MNRLVVALDEDSATLDLFDDILSTEGYSLQRCGIHALKVCTIQAMQPEFLILELHPRFPDILIAFLHQLRAGRRTNRLPVIVTCTDDRLLDLYAQRLGHLGCLSITKPFALDQFLQLIAEASDLQGYDSRYGPLAERC